MVLLKRFRGWRWPFIAGGLLVLVIALVGMRLHGGETNAQGDLADHIVITMVAGSFYLAGVATFLRLEAPAEAGSAYGVFLCAALVFCLLNQSTVHENVIAMSLLAVIAHGLATTFACQLLFPTGWSIRGVRLLPALPFVLSCALCGISLPLLVVAPAPWMVTTLLVYIFPVVCMVVITGSIFAGLRRASESRRSVHGMALLGIVLVLLSLAIIAAKSTPFDIVYQPATVGFLLFYAFFAAAMALGSGIFFWAWGRLTLRLLRLLAPVAFVGLGIALAFSVKHFSNFSMTFLRDSLQNLFTYHLFSIPLLILPVICCYALVYRQLSE